ncbi:MAG: hypothetical protein GX957_08450 [Clostridiaceae bacterium]|nr:hypothetical protein [Clostridiaceae bacterium]
MRFKKYQHVERFGNEEVDGIEIGECYIFPKLDGTNASVWMDSNGDICAGSRHRQLSLENDNAGFYEYITKQDNIKQYLQKYPEHRLYGEFLVPHSLRTYREDAWRKFYIFDVCLDAEDNKLEYLPFDFYYPLLEEFKLEYISPLAKVKNGSYEHFIRELEKNVFLIEDGKGIGEGIVIKNYSFYNKYERQIWAKIVTNEFKEKHTKTMGYPIQKAKKTIEENIVSDYCTTAFIEKEFFKIVTEKEGWCSEYIPMLFGRIYSELIKEECWNIVKEYKNPKINFKALNALVIQKIKEVKQELF